MLIDKQTTSKTTFQELTKFFNQSSRSLKIKPRKLYDLMIEMTYQLNSCLAISTEYQKYQAEHQKFRQLFQIVIFDNPFSDVLAEVSNELNNLDKSFLGQCPTPDDISALTGQILAQNIEENTYFADFCCGSGSLCFGYASEFLKSEAISLNLLIGDIDEIALKSAIIQLQYNDTLHCRPKGKYLNIRAILGNSLLNDKKKVIFSPDLSEIEDDFVCSVQRANNLALKQQAFNHLGGRFRN